jgi:hypothetical protein
MSLFSMRIANMMRISGLDWHVLGRVVSVGVGGWRWGGGLGEIGGTGVVWVLGWGCVGLGLLWVVFVVWLLVICCACRT